jgi:hypothetical protein
MGMGPRNIGSAAEFPYIIRKEKALKPTNITSFHQRNLRFNAKVVQVQPQVMTSISTIKQLVGGFNHLEKY